MIPTAPRRLDCDTTSLCRRIDAGELTLVISLNGEEIEDVVAYDMDAGTITRSRKVDGHFVIEGDEIASETLTGTVQVEVKETGSVAT